MEKIKFKNDPRGLIFEAYRIDGINENDCRTIFFDWLLGLDSESNPTEEIQILFNRYSKKYINHPMTSVLREGLERPALVPRRRSRKK